MCRCLQPHFQASVKSQRPAAAKLLRNSKKRVRTKFMGLQITVNPRDVQFWFFKKNVLNFSSFCSSIILPVLKCIVFFLAFGIFLLGAPTKKKPRRFITVGNWNSPWGFQVHRITTYLRLVGETPGLQLIFLSRKLERGYFDVFCRFPKATAWSSMNICVCSLWLFEPNTWDLQDYSRFQLKAAVFSQKILVPPAVISLNFIKSCHTSSSGFTLGLPNKSKAA